MTSIQHLNGEALSEIMYLPAGPHVDGTTARLLQSDLEELLEAPVKPYIDFDHQGKAAAADPKRFIWKPNQGVFLRLAWTRSGRSAVEGRDYRYFAPALRFNGQGEIEGLPASGAIGSLVNNPGPSVARERQMAKAEAAAAGESLRVAAGGEPFPIPGEATSYAKMLAQRKAIQALRKSQPKLSTDEVFRVLKQQNPQLMKD